MNYQKYSNKYMERTFSAQTIKHALFKQGILKNAGISNVFFAKINPQFRCVTNKEKQLLGVSPHDRPVRIFLSVPFFITFCVKSGNHQLRKFTQLGLDLRPQLTC